MTPGEFHDPRATERRNPRTVDLDISSSLGIVDLLNREDRAVAAAVGEAREAIARTIDLVVDAFRSGGRLVYVGAGTSGRLGVLDAAECPPTFGVAPGRVEGILAGGPEALVRSREGVEDDEEAGAQAVIGSAVGGCDVVVGIAASGTTPFVATALAEARRRGARTALVCCSEPPAETVALCDETILARTGPEALTGSTRLKAGTATKMILNALTTGAMIRTGRVYGNLMVDLVATSAKLRDRAERIVMEAAGVDRDGARRSIAAADGRAKVAVVMAKLAVSAEEARRRLETADGSVRAVAGAPPEVPS